MKHREEETKKTSSQSTIFEKMCLPTCLHIVFGVIFTGFVCSSCFWWCPCVVWFNSLRLKWMKRVPWKKKNVGFELAFAYRLSCLATKFSRDIGGSGSASMGRFLMLMLTLEGCPTSQLRPWVECSPKDLVVVCFWCCCLFFSWKIWSCCWSIWKVGKDDQVGSNVKKHMCFNSLKIRRKKKHT